MGGGEAIVSMEVYICVLAVLSFVVVWGVSY